MLKLCLIPTPQALVFACLVFSSVVAAESSPNTFGADEISAGALAGLKAMAKSQKLVSTMVRSGLVGDFQVRYRDRQGNSRSASLNQPITDIDVALQILRSVPAGENLMRQVDANPRIRIRAMDIQERFEYSRKGIMGIAKIHGPGSADILYYGGSELGPLLSILAHEIYHALDPNIERDRLASQSASREITQLQSQLRSLDVSNPQLPAKAGDALRRKREASMGIDNTRIFRQEREAYDYENKFIEQFKRAHPQGKAFFDVWHKGPLSDEAIVRGYRAQIPLPAYVDYSAGRTLHTDPEGSRGFVAGVCNMFSKLSGRRSLRP